ncbi:tRNA (guanine-N(7)-)-methyltransferase (tRNA(m7G46)-methyltransferase), partial [Spiromyces aspiralis]
MLDFAQKGGNFRLDSSFFLTKYMHYRWAGGGGNADNSDDEVHSMAKEVANEMAVIQQMPGTEAAIQTLLDLVIRDFIQLWFRTLSADPSFSGSVKAEIASILRHIIARIERFDISRFFMVRVVPILSRHLHEYRKAEKAALRVISLGGKAGGKRPPSMPSAGRNVRRLRSKTLTGITKSSGPDGDE